MQCRRWSEWFEGHGIGKVLPHIPSPYDRKLKERIADIDVLIQEEMGGGGLGKYKKQALRKINLKTSLGWRDPYVRLMIPRHTSNPSPLHPSLRGEYQ